MGTVTTDVLDPGLEPGPDTGFIANKEFAMAGKKYRRGDSVDVSDLRPGKVTQLADQRWIKSTAVEAPASYVAAKAILIAGVSYQTGDPVDTSALPAHKVSQFLDQRMIRPATQA